MQTAKMNSKSKKNGKSAVLMPVVPGTVGPQARDTESAEPQTTVADTVPVEQPTAHPETDVRLPDLNKIVNSTYNPRKNFRQLLIPALPRGKVDINILNPIIKNPVAACKNACLPENLFPKRNNHMVFLSHMDKIFRINIILILIL